MKKSQCFVSLHLGGRGASAQKDQRFTFFIDIELWMQSLRHVAACVGEKSTLNLASSTPTKQSCRYRDPTSS